MKSPEKRRTPLELSKAFRATPITLLHESVWRGTPAMTARVLSAPAMACFTVILCWPSRSIPPLPQWRAAVCLDGRSATAVGLHERSSGYREYQRDEYFSGAARMSAANFRLPSERTAFQRAVAEFHFC